MQASGQQRKVSLRHVSLMREISAFSSAIADVALSEPWLGILPIALYGSQELQDELLPSYLAGRLLPAFALSEPDAGSDAAAITTTAHRDGNHYVINGRKTWTSNCGLADLYVVFARIEGQAGAGGIATFAIDGGDSGIEIEERLSVLPPHTVGTWTLKDCRVPSQRLIGKFGQGFKIALRLLRTFPPDSWCSHIRFRATRHDESHCANVSAQPSKNRSRNTSLSRRNLPTSASASMLLLSWCIALLGSTMLPSEALRAKLQLPNSIQQRLPSISLIRQCRFLAALASFEVRRWNVCFGIPGHFEFSTEPAKFSSSS